MDDIVKQAMAKWPNVPFCYGWLALDARGEWRMRDDAAQAEQQPGERIHNPALLAFINRNYQQDEQGRWFFQNGPQRAFVDLATTPYIARTDPAQGLVLHTDAPFTPSRAWLTCDGEFLFQDTRHLAALDDRDLAHCLSQLHETTAPDSAPIEDGALMAWLEHAVEHGAPLHLRLQNDFLSVELLPYSVKDARCSEKFRFVRQPRA